MADAKKYRLFFMSGTSFDVSPEDGQDVADGLDDHDKISFEVVMRKTENGNIIRKFPREALESIEYLESDD